MTSRLHETSEEGADGGISVICAKFTRAQKGTTAAWVIRCTEKL